LINKIRAHMQVFQENINMCWKKNFMEQDKIVIVFWSSTSFSRKLRQSFLEVKEGTLQVEVQNANRVLVESAGY